MTRLGNLFTIPCMTKLSADTMTVREAALALNISTQRVYQLIESKQLRNTNRTGSSAKLSRKQVHARIAALASPDLRNGQ